MSQHSAVTKSAQDELWQLAKPEAATVQNNVRTARSTETWLLNRAALIAVLKRAPREAVTLLKNSSAFLTLPLPDGSLRRFRIVDSPLFAPALAEQFPDIKSYYAQSASDDAMIARVAWSSQGLHAHILTPDSSYHVEPVTGSQANLYRVEVSQEGKPGFQCEVREADQRENSRLGTARRLAPALANGATLRTYRLAVATTWEFSNAHGGGTNAGTLAAINVWLNAVNVIYERELALRLTLVNNTNILYTTQNGFNAATDPFTNSNKFTLLNQVRTVLRDVVGQSNYDVGHVLGTGSLTGSNAEGVALLGVTCNNADHNSDGLGPRKGGGATVIGTGATAGNSSGTWALTHELAHQFGASHTFNTEAEGCNSNRAPLSAVEPGSGQTLMAYAGLCWPDNTASTPEFRFHTQSYTEILNYLSSPTGGSCGTLTATGNNVPSINAGADYTIPKNTPFTLTATGNDADANDFPNLTYIWEQVDAGNSWVNPPFNDGSDTSGTTRPIFRAYSPVKNPYRTFPDLAYVLGYANDPPDKVSDLQSAEELPRVGRTLNFRATVRDQRGGVNDDSVAVTVHGNAGPFRVTTPGSGSTLWAGGSSQTITWDVANTQLAPVSCVNVKISLSTDGGVTFPHILAASTPNDGTELITIPTGINTANARIKIESVGNVFFDISDVDFSISCLQPITPNTLTLVSFGSNGNINVTGNGCTWTATSEASWITITAGATGTGNGSVAYTVETNTGSAREGKIIIGGQLITVYQSAVPCTSVTINPTGSLPLATVGKPYAQNFSVTGGTSPLTFSYSGNLPPGLTLLPSGTLIGVPTIGGSFLFTIRVTNGTGCATTRPYLINVSAISITPTFLPLGLVNVTYSANLTASGGSSPYTFNLTAGTLPSGISLSNTGSLTGTTSQAGIFPITVRATDAASAFGEFNLNLVIRCADTSFSFGSLANAFVGVNFNQSLDASGGTPPHTFTLGSGSLPSGMTLSSSGVLSGTPAQSGSFPFLVFEKDVNSCVRVTNYTLSVLCFDFPVFPGLPTEFQLGESVFTQLYTQVTVTPINYRISAGTLPPGLTLSPEGMLAGTVAPAAGLRKYCFTVRVTERYGCYTDVTYCINTVCGLSIGFTGGPLAVGLPVNENLGVGGGLPPIVFSVESGTLPPGLSLSANGQLSGTPTQAGSFNATIHAADANGCETSQSIFFEVLCFYVNPPYSSLNYGVTGGNGTISVIAENATCAWAATVSYANPVSPWITINPPTSGSGSTTLNYTVAPNNGGYREANIFLGPFNEYHIFITQTASECAELGVSPSVLPGGVAFTPYSQVMSVTGGSLPQSNYTWSVIGTLPNGVTFNSTTRTLSGTPTHIGLFPITLRATHSSGCYVELSESINILCNVIGPEEEIIPTATRNQPYSHTLSFTNARLPVTLSTISGLPAGMTLSAAGVFSGTPTVAGEYTITYNVTDANTCTRNHQRYLTVCRQIAINPATLPAGLINTAYSQSLSASGGIAPYFYQIVSGNLPPGITLNANSGLLSGTPTQAGNFAFTASVEDISGATCAVTKTYNLVINCASLALNPISRAHSSASASNSISVTSPGSCNWIAFSDSPWLTITSGGSGIGNGTINYSITSNTGNARNGAIKLANQTFTVTQAAAPLAGVFLSAANYSNEAAPNSVVMAMVRAVTNGVTAATASPLPTSLSGISVNVTDSTNVTRTAGLYFVAPEQVNFLMPAGTANGIATVTVVNGNGMSFEGTIQVAAVSPGLFSAESNGQGVMRGLAIRNSTTIESVARFDQSSRRWVTLALAGPTNQLVLVLTGTGFRHYAALPTATVGGTPVTVVSATASPVTLGFDELRLQLPAGLPSGTHNINVTVDGKLSNIVTVAIQ